MLHCLYIEADGGNRVDHFAQLQLVENGGFTGRVQPEYQNALVVFREQALQDLREDDAHGSGARSKADSDFETNTAAQTLPSSKGTTMTAAEVELPQAALQRSLN